MSERREPVPRETGQQVVSAGQADLVAGDGVVTSAPHLVGAEADPAASPASASRASRVRLALTACVLVAMLALAGVCAGMTAQPAQQALAADDGEAGATSSQADAADASDTQDGVTVGSATVGTSDDELAAAVKAYEQATPKESGTCLACHTDADMLEATKSSDDVDANLYLVDEAYATTTHGLLGCTYCHGGDATATDAATAMADIDAYPTSDGGQAVCGQCHADVVESYATSLHYTTAGLECAYANRLSQASDEAGTDLASANYRGVGCPDCHADCGECHVRNAKTMNAGVEYNGLIDGHMFVDGTDNDDITGTCLTCHAGSITSCYSNYDVHGLSGANMNCMDCHEASEIHGDGVERTTMTHSGAITTACEDCHDASELTGEWHSESHLESAECWSCHSVSYNTCRSCHGWSAAEREDEPFTAADELHLGYDQVTGKITTLVKAPVDAGMLGDAGVELDDADLNTGSTWYTGFAHGIVTPELSQELCNRCHGEGTALLSEDNLQYPDYESDQVVTPLPAVDVGDYADE